MLKLKRFTEGQWIDYPGADKVSFLIRPVNLSTGLSIRSKVRDKVAMDVVDPKTGKKVYTLMEDVDTGRFSWEAFDYMLQDFKGIALEDEKGNPLELSKDETKKAIFDNDDLRNFITGKAEELATTKASELEDEVKNSKSSQSG